MTDFIYKLQGTGNDFLILDIRKPQNLKTLENHYKSTNRSEIVKQICHRKFGVGADGFIFVESSDLFDFKWDFYNSDGSKAEMCGNATRCIVIWANKYKGFGKSVTFETVAGDVTAEVLSDDRVKTKMPPLEINDETGQINIEGTCIDYLYVNTGVPHVVFAVDDLSNPEDYLDVCSQIRNHKKFQPHGTNVTLVHSVNESKINSISFERGVENFTLSCGTGTVAAAFYQHQNFSEIKQIDVKVPGGQLTVDFNQSRPMLIGPAKSIMKLTLI